MVERRPKQSVKMGWQQTFRLSTGAMAICFLIAIHAAANPPTSQLNASNSSWHFFETVSRPPVPQANANWVRNPIDAFIAAKHHEKNLKGRPEASKEILLRRVYLDLIGLVPTPEEQHAFLSDDSSQAYEKLVDRLLDDPRYGERWGRHWMDVWRYSDWAGWSGGNQIRDSKPHIWRWKDWIIESLNKDKPYDRMVIEMLAADELAPDDPDALRATGYLVRNYKMLSREQWLEDTIKHTSQAFLGVTMGCAKCHDHKTDPIAQEEYYRVRSIFEPHQVRTDRIPGELDTAKSGLVHAYDTDTNATTYLFDRGDERKPDTNRVMSPGVPRALDWSESHFEVQPVKLPKDAAQPDKRQFVIDDLLAASKSAVSDAQKAFEKGGTNSYELRLKADAAKAKHEALLTTIAAEKLEDAGKKDSEEWKSAALKACDAQRNQKFCEARLALHQAKTAEGEAASRLESAAADKKSKIEKDLEATKKKTAEAEKAFTEAQKESEKAISTAYKPRPAESYPAQSTGRRLAFARWITDPRNPLTARVAMNHIWLRHFGRGIVPTPENFGRSGQPASHPELLDWLASEFMTRGWSMKAMHRMIVTSATYRMASTPDEANAKIDPDNIFLWRMPSRRMEAELIRDNLLYVSGNLDPAIGGPDIDNALGLVSKRRSMYLRIAAEKEVEFLTVFDGPTATECYQRRPTVMPQQALALANNELGFAQSKILSRKLSEVAGDNDDQFIRAAFRRILSRSPKKEELAFCREFLAGFGGSKGSEIIRVSNVASADRGRQNLVLVLFNHTDFVTIR